MKRSMLSDIIAKILVEGCSDCVEDGSAAGDVPHDRGARARAPTAFGRYGNVVSAASDDTDETIHGHPFPPDAGEEGMFVFDKFIDDIVAREDAKRVKVEQSSSPQRILAERHTDRPANRTRVAVPRR